MTVTPQRTDTICAPATPAGGALCVVRVSGPQALAATERIFSPRGGTPLSERRGFTLCFGEIRRADDTLIDEAVASVFRAPHSYTGEDAVELSCHGSAYIMSQVLDALVAAGCRMAEPGEFTKRAFLAGKMDLSQAEAVADLIASSNAATHSVALRQMRGSVSSELQALRDQLLHFATMLELELDFSDHEDLEFADRSQLLALCDKSDATMSRLIDTFRAAGAIKNGIPTIIVGAPNVGKSTLLNALLGEERAIVSHVQGTTRDAIEDVVTIQGVTFRFVDTAGLRATDDAVEQIGIERTHQKLKQAAIILWLTDATRPDDEAADELSDLPPSAEQTIVRIYNKCDCLSPAQMQQLQQAAPASEHRLFISAKSQTGLDALRALLVEIASSRRLTSRDAIVTNARHHEALQSARESLRRARRAVTAGLSGDLVSQDLRDCLARLGEITGAVTSEAVLQNIFAHFCVGK